MIKIKSKKVLIPLVVVAIAAVSLKGFMSAQEKPQDKTFTIYPRELVKTVAIAGTVKPAEEVELAFEKSGRITKLNYDINDFVEEGDVLAEISADDALASLSDAKASVSNAQAVYAQYQANIDLEKARIAQLEANLQREENILEEVKRGAREEDINLAQASLENTKKSIEEAQKALDSVNEQGTVALSSLYAQASNTLDEAYGNGDDILYRLTSDLFRDSTTYNPKLVFDAEDNKDSIAEKSRVSAMRKLEELGENIDEIALFNASNPDNFIKFDEALMLANSTMDELRISLNDLSKAINDSILITSLSESTYRANIELSRSEITATTSAINSLTQQIANQKTLNKTNSKNSEIALLNAQNQSVIAAQELEKTLSGSSSEQIKAQEAVVAKAQADIDAQRAAIKSAEANLASGAARIEQAKAGVARYNVEFDKSKLTAPISGQITSRDYSLGEIAAATQPVFTLISSANYEIIADIPEIDIASIEVGQSANVYLDAYGEDVPFDAVITKIEPAERIVNGLSVYRVTLQFIDEDDRVKSGMTANLKIAIWKKSGIFAIPLRSIIHENGDTFVMLKDQNAASFMKKVVLGSVGDGAEVEVTSGLAEGDVLVLEESQ